MNTENMIDITGTDLTKFVQAVYDLSRPQGLGFLHARDGGLSDEDAAKLRGMEKPDGHIALSMDYVHGRACKMTVWRDDGKLWINNTWYDHGPSLLTELLKRIGVSAEVSDRVNA